MSFSTPISTFARSSVLHEMNTKGRTHSRTWSGRVCSSQTLCPDRPKNCCDPTADGRTGLAQLSSSKRDTQHRLPENEAASFAADTSTNRPPLGESGRERPPCSGGRSSRWSAAGGRSRPDLFGISCGTFWANCEHDIRHVLSRLTPASAVCSVQPSLLLLQTQGG